MWTLSHGCHNGKLSSRSAANPQEFPTRQEAIKAYEDHRDFYHSIGYQIWFATLTSPDGKKESLERNFYK